MLGNAALFLSGALQHAGVAIGPLREPVIIPASIVELLCALVLIWGAAAVLIRSHKAWRAVLIGNLVAIAGAKIVGADGRTEYGEGSTPKKRRRKRPVLTQWDLFWAGLSRGLDALA
jgi:hypothetical protein